MSKTPFSGKEADLLSLLQRDFPLTDRPFAEVAKRVGFSERDVVGKVRLWHERGVIRRIGPSVDFRRLGYFTTLVGARVEKSETEKVGALVSQIAWVSHNYIRRHLFNLWFTLTVPDRALVDEVLQPVREHRAVETLFVLPMVKLFKLNVHFDVRSGKGAAKGQSHRHDGGRVDLQEVDRRLLRALQAGLSPEPEPFAAVARRVGLSVEEVLKRLKTLQDLGVVRRFGAILHHRRVGVHGNVMAVWLVPEGQVDAAGRYLASRPEVSHAYQRVTAPGWPYQLYTMIHAQDERGARDLVAEWQRVVGAERVELLVTEKELKKQPIAI